MIDSLHHLCACFQLGTNQRKANLSNMMSHFWLASMKASYLHPTSPVETIKLSLSCCQTSDEHSCG